MQVSKIALPSAFDVRVLLRAYGMYWKHMIELGKKRIEMGKRKQINK